MLGPDAEADQVRRDAGELAAFLALLLMGRDRGDRGDALDPF